MGSETQDEDWMPGFHVCHYDSFRNFPIVYPELDQAQNCGYDMMATPITNDHFQTRINALISDHLSGDSIPTVPPLTHLDTVLVPGARAKTLLVFTPSWIEICAPDPMVSEISKQILHMEVAYAVFCGAPQLFVQGPKIYHRDPFLGKDLFTNNVTQFARAIHDALSLGNRIHISIVLPFYDDSSSTASYPPTIETREQYLDDVFDERSTVTDGLVPWDSWNTIRTFCKYPSRLNAALELPRYLPPLYIQSRWFSEPVRALIASPVTFVKNEFGYPTLFKTTQTFLKRIMRLNVPPWLIFRDISPLPGLEDPDELVTEADGFIPPEAARSPNSVDHLRTTAGSATSGENPLSHLDYARYLQKSQPPRTDVERYGAGYQDYLQTPLQPLVDNLESMTYEVFEKDPVKYMLYEQAVRKALRDWADEKKSTSSPDGKVVVAVVGAGRGPLVTRALKASKKENVPIEIWAVEKNPSAFVILHHHNQEHWQGAVHLVQSDMRSWKGPYHTSASAPLIQLTDSTASVVQSTTTIVHHPVDILISELLGSFADNELSPECLDGIMHLLAKPHGISIPRSYTAYLTPIAAPKLHTDIAARAPFDTSAHETPAVVWLYQVDYLSPQPTGPPGTTPFAVPEDAPIAGTGGTGSPTPAPPPHVLKVWEFHHGPLTSSADSVAAAAGSDFNINVNTNSHNARFTKLRFRTRTRGVCHGLGGYFEAVLYPGVELSTHPNSMEEKSQGMISWFPIFFPLKTPLYFPSATALDVSMWRQTDGRKVWYEWMVESWGWNRLKTGRPMGSVANGSNAADSSNRQTGPGLANVASRSDGEGNSSKAKAESGGDKAKKRELPENWGMIRLGMTELHSSVKNACLL